jgi:PAS domain S-box-containing protein
VQGQKLEMKIRTVISVLALLAFLSASVGGYLFYSLTDSASVLSASLLIVVLVVFLYREGKKAIIRDIIGRNRAEEEVSKLNEELEERVIERSAELVRANKQLRQEIEERKQAVEERIRLATAVDQAAESVIISDKRGTIQYVNPAFERLSGFTKDDIVGRNFRVLKSDTHDDDFYREMWGTITTGKGWAGQIDNRMKDGSLRQFETTISPIRDDSGAIVNFVSVNRDVTQEVALEAQLLQAQKMEAVGTLAGGIAHDFNNLLQVIQGYTEVLLHGVNEDPSHHEALQKIHRSRAKGGRST